MMHRARPYDLTELRKVISTRIRGEAPHDLGVDGRTEKGMDTPAARESSEALANEIARLKALTEAKKRPDFKDSPWFGPWARTRSAAL